MWLSSIVDRIIVGHKTIRIIGRSDNFERGLKTTKRDPPRFVVLLRNGAARGIRTPDPLITNEVLYQLSYCGV
jgi:hypothetical protein